MYDEKTGHLRLMIYASNADGKFDTWMYMDGDHPLRMELDEDGDGVIDEWSYYGADGKVERIGTSSAHNGRPDTWRIVGSETTAGDAKGAQR